MRSRAQTPAPDRPTSVLAVDFGNVHTRAVLIDLVEGVYALVGEAEEMTTGGFPAGDVSVGLARVLHKLGAATGRTLVSGDGRVITPEQPDRSGVDVFITTASIGRPLRTILIGLVPDISLLSGQRAAAGTYINIVDTLTLDDTRTDEQRLNDLIHAEPDLIFIVGGTEDGAATPILELAESIRMAIRLIPTGARPRVLFAGNSAAANAIRTLFGSLATVLTADNVRPSLDEEALAGAQLQLALAYDSVAGARDLAFEQIGEMSRLGVLPNAQSYALIMNFLGQSEPGKNFAAFDVGSAVSTLSASVGGTIATSIRTDIGLGHSAISLLETLGSDAIRRWLPFPASEAEITAYALNKTLRPAGIPETLRDLYLEHAFIRAAIIGLLDAARPAWTPTQALDDPNAPLPPFERLIGAGAGLTNTGRPGMAALLMLDTLQPPGVVRLQLDSGALLPALGALARVNAQAVVQLLDAQGLEELGTAITLSGTIRPGQTAATVRILLADGRKETHKVEGGTLWVYPVGIGVHVMVTITAARGLTIGGKRRVKIKADGGSAGLIIDGRGRPLPLAADARIRGEQIASWYAQATGDPIRAIDAEWLAAEQIAASLSGQQTPEDEIVSVSRRTDKRKAEKTAAPPAAAADTPSAKRGRRGKHAPKVAITPLPKGQKNKRGKGDAVPQPSAEELIASALYDEGDPFADLPASPAPTDRRGAAGRASTTSRNENIDDLRDLLS